MASPFDVHDKSRMKIKLKKKEACEKKPEIKAKPVEQPMKEEVVKEEAQKEEIKDQ